MVEKSIIITGGGVGKRMGAEVPKQFLLLNNRPILMWTIEKFFTYDPQIEIILVLPENQIAYWNSLCAHYNFTVNHRCVAGGKERFDSVKNGLEKASGELIGVHDAVRPLVSNQVIVETYAAAAIYGASIPVVSLTESLRQVKENDSFAVKRSDFKLVQTPQCFTSSVLRSAYQKPYQDFYTDDASVVEADGHKIHLVDGNEENIKITSPADLKIAAVLF
jgi:2-C-methyl-D-erythritol 4-phosphate cytidylyltransferase